MPTNYWGDEPLDPMIPEDWEEHVEYDDDREYEDAYDDDYDDGQPTEYEEWQDLYGGDDWDQGQYDDY